MTSMAYIAESLPWAIAGLLAGFLMARSTKAVVSIADAVQEGETVVESRRSRFTFTHLIGVVLILLSIGTAFQGYVQGRETERIAACTKAYADGFADAIDERSKSAAEAQQALDDLVTAFYNATPTPEGREVARKAFTDYVEKRAAARRAQQEHPYPAPPRDVCD